MTKSFLLFSVIFFLSSCSLSYEYNLNQMSKGLERHFQYNDQEKNIITNIDFIKPLSYIKLGNDDRVMQDDVYLARFYVKGKWMNDGSSLVYNINDTIACYFDKNMRYLRMKPNE